MSNAVLRFPEVKTLVGLSRSAIYAAVAEGRFPRPINLGARAVSWLQSEIEAWSEQRVSASRSLECA